MFFPLLMAQDKKLFLPRKRAPTDPHASADAATPVDVPKAQHLHSFLSPMPLDSSVLP